jgi:hypothetical protein
MTISYTERWGKLLPAEERDADAAFLHLSKLRDRLVWADENTAACRVDEAIERLEEACRVLREKLDA